MLVTGGQVVVVAFAVSLDIVDEQLHLGDFAGLGLGDCVREITNTWVADSCCAGDSSSLLRRAAGLEGNEQAVSLAITEYDTKNL